MIYIYVNLHDKEQFWVQFSTKFNWKYSNVFNFTETIVRKSNATALKTIKNYPC